MLDPANGPRSQVLLPLEMVNDVGDESDARCAQFSRDLPTTFGWENDMTRAKSRLIRRLREICA